MLKHTSDANVDDDEADEEDEDDEDKDACDEDHDEVKEERLGWMLKMHGDASRREDSDEAPLLLYRGSRELQVVRDVTLKRRGVASLLPCRGSRERRADRDVTLKQRGVASLLP
eukprot:GEMP01094685.1.p4 GENE.GEMP01094685.1~~GEMP01094685.1.p4  ORF type:complete len:114 (-),score=33.14 GEMP01094685.1:187-528(-)